MSGLDLYRVLKTVYFMKPGALVRITADGLLVPEGIKVGHVPVVCMRLGRRDLYRVPDELSSFLFETGIIDFADLESVKAVPIAFARSSDGSKFGAEFTGVQLVVSGAQNIEQAEAKGLARFDTIKLTHSAKYLLPYIDFETHKKLEDFLRGAGVKLSSFVPQWLTPTEKEGERSAEKEKAKSGVGIQKWFRGL